MKKTMSFDEIEQLFGYLSKEWLSLIPQIHISNKSLYNLIALKRTLEAKHFAIQETVVAIMRKHGAVENEEGRLQVPEENIAETNEELIILGQQTDEIESNEILIKEEDSITSELMEILYDFIVIE